MVEITDLKIIKGDLWARVGKPGEFPSGVMVMEPEEAEKLWDEAIIRATCVMSTAMVDGRSMDEIEDRLLSLLYQDRVDTAPYDPEEEGEASTVGEMVSTIKKDLNWGKI